MAGGAPAAGGSGLVVVFHVGNSGSPMSRLVSSKTVEIRLTIFPATQYKLYTDFTIRWWRIFCDTRSRARRLHIYIYICISISIYIFAAVSNGKVKAWAIFLNPLTICSLCKRKFVIGPFVYKETSGSYLFANGLNGLAHLCQEPTVWEGEGDQKRGSPKGGEGYPYPHRGM
jgi:hypothetical protein